MIVANSTPLIALSKIGLFDLLHEYFGEVTIPKEVGAVMKKTRGGVDARKVREVLVGRG